MHLLCRGSFYNIVDNHIYSRFLRQEKVKNRSQKENLLLKPLELKHLFEICAFLVTRYLYYDERDKQCFDSGIAHIIGGVGYHGKALIYHGEGLTYCDGVRCTCLEPGRLGSSRTQVTIKNLLA